MMTRVAVIDCAGEIAPKVISVLSDHGLKFIGTFNRGMNEHGQSDVLRLIVRDELGTILPPECEGSAWWLVSAAFTIESYGEQHITKVSSIELVGELRFGSSGEAKVMPRAA